MLSLLPSANFITLGFLLPIPPELIPGAVKFRKQFIPAESFESVGVFDVNGDKVPDFLSGNPNLFPVSVTAPKTAKTPALTITWVCIITPGTAKFSPKM
jgi:hypothetical protein